MLLFKFRVFINTLLLVWPFLYFVLYSWPNKNLKSSNVLWSMSWLIHNFVFQKTPFFSLNFHCFYKQFTKITALFYLTLFTIIHLYFKSIQIKFAGEFLLTSFNGFFNIFWQIRYYSFSTFAQNETMLTTTLILKNPTKRQANQKRPVLRSCFQF